MDRSPTWMKMFRGWALRTILAASLILLAWLYFMSSELSSHQRSALSNDLGLFKDKVGDSFHPRQTNSWRSGKDRNWDYRIPDPRVGLEKIVHFDLKGMQPLVKYFKEIFPLLKKLKVSGILMEYEDTFPYIGNIESLSSKDAYTKSEIRQINQLAKENGLQIIPLIQTFGHLEFALKLEKYAELREVEKYPQVLCPSNNKSAILVKEMISQVMSLHPESQYLHIGSDEVYYIGLCSVCTSRMDQMHLDGVALFLDHVKTVASYVIDNFKIRPIMWDDQFRNLDLDVIQKSSIGKMVDVVVWNYHEDVEKRLLPALWDKYSQVFTSVWIGSAFKGADQPNSIVSNETKYLGNHYSWVHLMREQQSKINFKGVMLTGWQRYDHFSVLCEIFPVAVPSLVSALTFLNHKGPSGMLEVFANASFILDCSTIFEYCRFPGSDIHHAIREIYRYQVELKKMKKESTFLGWADGMNLNLLFSSPSHVENLFYEVSSIKFELERIEKELKKSLRDYFPLSAVDEWLYTFLHPFYREVKTLFFGFTKILEKKSFPVRPLDFKNGNPFLDQKSPNEI